MSTTYDSLNPRLRRLRAYSLVHPQIIGDVKLSALQADHERWLLCDGRLVKRSDFPELFAAIGHSFGGWGSRFRLPDGRARVPAAASGPLLDISGGRVMGEAVGSETHVLTLEELTPHTHTINASATGVTTNEAGSHTHTATTESSGSHTHTATTDSSGNHTHTVSNTVVQNGLSTRTDVDNDGPAGEINLDTSQTTTTSTAGAHTHTLTTQAAGEHTHTLTTQSAGAHTHGITDPTHIHTANSTGGGAPFNIMQPTLFVGQLFIFCGRRVGVSGPVEQRAA
jgi:microcystin-dependent protein